MIDAKVFNEIIKELQENNPYLKFLLLAETPKLPAKLRDFNIKTLSLAIKELKESDNECKNVKKIIEIKGDDIEIPDNMLI